MFFFRQVPSSGQGIFALKNLPANSIVAFYNGVRFNDCHVSLNIELWIEIEQTFSSA
jgi:hypothetical protein